MGQHNNDNQVSNNDSIKNHVNHANISTGTACVSRTASKVICQRHVVAVAAFASTNVDPSSLNPPSLIGIIIGIFMLRPFK